MWQKKRYNCFIKCELNQGFFNLYFLYYDYVFFSIRQMKGRNLNLLKSKQTFSFDHGTFLGTVTKQTS